MQKGKIRGLGSPASGYFSGFPAFYFSFCLAFCIFVNIGLKCFKEFEMLS